MQSFNVSTFAPAVRAHSSRFRFLSHFNRESLGDQSGVSLVGVIVAVGISSVVATAMAQQVKNNLDATSLLSQKVDYASVQRQMGVLLANPDVCLATAKSFALGQSNQNIRILSRNNAVLMATGQKIGEGLKITRLVADVPSPGTANVTLGTITMEATKRGLKQGAATVSAQYFVNILTDGTTILDCSLTDDPRDWKLRGVQRFTQAPSGLHAANGTYNEARFTYRPKGNFIQASIGSVSWVGTGAYMESRLIIQNSSTGAYILSPPGAIVCGAITASGINTDTCDVTLPLAVNPLHSYVFTLNSVVSITAAGGAAQQVSAAYLKVEDYIKPAGG